MKKLWLVALFLLPTFVGIGQDTAKVRSLIEALCDPRYNGRGYVEQGDVRAADFLVRQCALRGMQPVNGSFVQPFNLAVNTFPGELSLALNGWPKVTGQDFIPVPESPALHGAFKATYIKPSWADNREKLFKLSLKPKVKEGIVVLDGSETSPGNQALIGRLNEDPLGARGYFVLTDKKLTWSVGRKTNPKAILQLAKGEKHTKIKNVDLWMDQEWVDNYRSLNVMSMIPGESDSMIVFTAHYDHLGNMGGDTFIAGASDNASGTAMLIDIADHYRKNGPKYTTVFIWFAAEEAGLVGSRYFVENSPIDLDKIKFLLNLDLMADAKTGITAVNGKIFSGAFERLEAINTKKGYLPEVKARGAAANSDHFPFFEKGVPSFFIYTRGDYKHYHDIYDVPEYIPLTNYEKVFKLLIEFVEAGC